jgi:hypothetical protein
MLASPAQIAVLTPRPQRVASLATERAKAE